jgi:hypothetical protein
LMVILAADMDVLKFMVVFLTSPEPHPRPATERGATRPQRRFRNARTTQATFGFQDGE